MVSRARRSLFARPSMLASCGYYTLVDPNILSESPMKRSPFVFSLLDRDASRILSTSRSTRACDLRQKSEPPIPPGAAGPFARMIRDAAIMLAFTTLATGIFAQNEQPQFSECLHQAT